MIKGIARGLIVFLLASIFSVQGVYAEPVSRSVQAATEYTLDFPSSRYPETGAHIRDAIAAGHSAVCTIDRDGAEENRKESLKGYPTKKGYDRDEWPMAMCAEGGVGADIRYITPSDNRGAGSWVSHQLDKYTDGTKVRFIVK
ncbi:NucA/NucB deoxyribonuclease domain-containing protein [Paenibacillus sp. Lou8.1]|uniref:NucA/NucB deoxyribonuclease domain-containing protein n=1 Tax=Paenibacillus sp. Lou8.1 TaxID=2962041 RepID=UPI0020B7A64F|nr:NucA/NucB deoxyribonuclease domain-containing protein [Paenibacillus sp. Lou8.1]MCP3806392.1 NucA/NucB deoxyribonuclease domain-containing protein [Paenibacillus sp. Lou8.1]